jgi:hypothetical protein
MVLGHKDSMRAEGILRDGDEEVMLVVLARVVGSKWKRSSFKWELDLTGDLEWCSSRLERAQPSI